jgi:hypothetical protein
VRKKTPAKRKGSKTRLPPGAVIYAEVTSSQIDGMRVAKVSGMDGPLSSVVARKGTIEVVLPSATLWGAPAYGRYVAWDGENYVLQPTLESILETDHLQLVGKVDDPTSWSPLHQQVEAYRQVKTLIGGPHEEIPEDLLRQTFAQQYGCEPEEVTGEQIRFEVSGLPRYYPAITVTPSVPLAQEMARADPVPVVATFEIARRAKLLADYKVATKTESNKRIYEAKNSEIYKAEFYKWIKGTLPATSATARNFERFLRENKPPVRW